MLLQSLTCLNPLPSFLSPWFNPLSSIITRQSTPCTLVEHTRHRRSLWSNASATNLLALKSSREVSSSMIQDLGHPPRTSSSLTSSMVLGDLVVARARASSILQATLMSPQWRCSLPHFCLPLCTLLPTLGPLPSLHGWLLKQQDPRRFLAFTLQLTMPYPSQSSWV